QTCTPQILSSSDPNSSSWLQKLIRIEFVSQSSYNVAMLCQKIRVVNERDPNDQIIVRSCQLDGAQTNPCSVAEDKIRDQQIRGYRIDHCSICSKDNCNGAMGLSKMWPPMGILLAMMTFVRVHLW
uniref:Protein quiver n=1 Tax=Lutzomyia longipalpis TaxID=7200 RepID=A0A1B0GGY3_LUTLO